MRDAMVLGVIAVGILAVAAGCGGDVTGESGGAGPGGAGPGGAGATSSGTGGAGSTTSGTGGGSFACATDADCDPGAQWCVGGVCVPCDNSGQLCDIACPAGWSTYERNGCSPCACAPINACASDADCPASGGGMPQTCYAGQLCWDWCPPGDPSCCYGNTCSAAGCPAPNPTGCRTTGCPEGEECADSVGCASSGCACDGQSWACLPDCGGGTCVMPN